MGDTDMPEPLLQFFAYEHLRPDLQSTSKQFSDLANWIFENVPRNPERTVALRKLLEAKDAGVRAQLYTTP
jgi:hypothetical protein